MAETDGKIMGLMVAEVVPTFLVMSYEYVTIYGMSLKEYRGSSVGVKITKQITTICTR